MKTLTIKKIDANSDINCRELRLLLAEKGHRAAARFQFGRYDPEQYWLIYVDGVLSYFSHSHLLNVEDKKYFRVGSKTTLLEKPLHLKIPKQLNGVTAPRARSALFYTATYHQLLWANKFNLEIPSIVTLFEKKDTDCPDSHRISNLIESDSFYGFDRNNKQEIFVNKKKLLMYFIDEKKIVEVYECIKSQFNIILEYD